MNASTIPLTVKTPPTIAQTLVKKCKNDELLSEIMTCKIREIRHTIKGF